MALSDLLKPRLVEIGKIKIGGLGEARQSSGGKSYKLPVKFDHFTIDTLYRDKDGRLMPDKELMEELAKDYADSDGQLRQLPIVVLSDTVDDVMQASWVWYGGKRVFARSDGRTVTWLADPVRMKTLVEPKTEDWKPEFADLRDTRPGSSNGNILFKLHTVFNCVIASKDSRWGGVYKLRTTSRITGEQLYGSLLHISQLTRGILRGLPMRLVVRPMQVAPNGQTTTVYVVHCELRGPDLLAIQEQAIKIASSQLAQARQIEATTIEYRRLLAPPGLEPPDEQEDIQQEFHPEDEKPATAPPPPTDPLMGDSPPTIGELPTVDDGNGASPDVAAPGADDQQEAMLRQDWIDSLAEKIDTATHLDDVLMIKESVEKNRERWGEKNTSELLKRAEAKQRQLGSEMSKRKK